MTTTMSFTELYNHCPTVTDASGVVSALEWLETVKAFALNSTDADMPNRMPVARDCNYYAAQIDKATTEYAPINNALTHVKEAIRADILLTNGSFPVG